MNTNRAEVIDRMADIIFQKGSQHEFKKAAEMIYDQIIAGLLTDERAEDETVTAKITEHKHCTFILRNARITPADQNLVWDVYLSWNGSPIGVLVSIHDRAWGYRTELEASVTWAAESREAALRGLLLKVTT